VFKILTVIMKIIRLIINIQIGGGNQYIQICGGNQYIQILLEHLVMCFKKINLICATQNCWLKCNVETS
jgi:hypothetical protein